MVRHDLLSVVHLQNEVPVLSGEPVAGGDLDGLGVDDRDGPGADGVYRRSVRRCDVDAEVEAEGAGAGHQSARAGGAVERHARIAEVAADRMRAVERLDGPAIAAARWAGVR